MDASQKRHQKWALAALDDHSKQYGKKIGGELRKFWAGDPWQYEGAHLKAKVPGFSQAKWQLSIVPPAWSALEDVGLDDAVVGPKGDWKQAGDFLPLFQAEEESCLIVAALAAPHAVGWFNEESWSSKQKGYRDGVFLLADSLEAFLATLTLADEDEEPEENFAWGDIDDDGDEDEDDEDEDDDEG